MNNPENILTEGSQIGFTTLESLQSDEQIRHSIGESIFEQTEDTNPLQFSTEKFADYCKTKLKVSSKNRVIKAKM